MKVVASFLLLLFSCDVLYAANESGHGIYAGAEINYFSYSAYDGSALHSRLLPLTATITPVLGYQFNDSLAVEAGYYNLIDDNSTGGYVDTFGTQGPDHYRLYFYALNGKWMLPIDDHFNFYAKFGAAIVHQDVYNQPYTALKPSANINSTSTLPLAGLGLDYRFNAHVVAEAGMTHMQGAGDVGNLDFLGFGLFYHF